MTEIESAANSLPVHLCQKGRWSLKLGEGEGVEGTGREGGESEKLSGRADRYYIQMSAGGVKSNVVLF